MSITETKSSLKKILSIIEELNGLNSDSIPKLQAQPTNLLEEIGKFEEFKTTNLNKIESNDDEINSLKNKISQNQRDIATLEEGNAELNNQRQNLLDKIQDAQNELNETQTKIIARREELITRSSRLEELENRIIELKDLQEKFGVSAAVPMAQMQAPAGAAEVAAPAEEKTEFSAVLSAVGDKKINQRIIKSRSGHTIILDDTDGEEKISIIDKTEKNTVEINSKDNAITINSEADITIEGKANLTLKGKTILIEAIQGGNIDVKGNNVNMQAQAKATLKGNSGADVEGAQVNVKGTAKTSVEGATVSVNGSAMTEIKGGLVKIN